MSEQIDQDIREAAEWFERIASTYPATVSSFPERVPQHASRAREVFWRRMTVFSAAVVCGLALLLFSIPEKNLILYVGAWVLIWSGFMGFMWWIVDGGRR